MSLGMQCLILFGSIGVLLLAGVWIAVALGVAGLLLLYVDGGTDPFDALGSIGWGQFNSFVLSAVPLFILMGQLLLASGVGDRFFEAVDVWFGRLPGGLLQGSVFSSGVFAAVTGSSVATAAAVGTVALPEMERRKYHMGTAGGTLAAGGTLGILIPPSIPLILYGALEGLSVSQLFAAALIPGLVLLLLFMVYVAVRVRVSPWMAGEHSGRRPTPAERARSLVSLLPIAVLILFVLGSIYLGWATPTEAAALGCSAALVISLPALTVRRFVDALRGTVETTAMVFAIILGAQIVTFALAETGMSRELTQLIIDQELSKYVLLGVILVLYIVLGDFIDGVSMMLLTLPLLYPVVVAAGFDPIWFGVIVVIMIEVGMITPPVGLNLFVIQGLSSKVTHGGVIVGAFPYVLLMLGLVLLLTIFPDIALWLPGQLSDDLKP